MSKIVQLVTGSFGDSKLMDHQMYGLDNDGCLYQYDFDKDEWKFVNGGEGVYSEVGE